MPAKMLAGPSFEWLCHVSRMLFSKKASQARCICMESASLCKIEWKQPVKQLQTH